MGREEWKCCGENVIGKSSNRERGEGNGEGGGGRERKKREGREIVPILISTSRRRLYIA